MREDVKGRKEGGKIIRRNEYRVKERSEGGLGEGKEWREVDNFYVLSLLFRSLYYLAFHSGA